MDTLNRKTLQGVRTIVRFNWHFFAIALAVIVALVLAGLKLPAFLPVFLLAAALVAAPLLLSLVASAHAYDFTGLYRLDWLDEPMAKASSAANIHSGFDETSATIRTRFPSVSLSILDFYNPAKHTEISIRRARKAHPPEPLTIVFESERIPLESRAIDVVLLTLAAHEIRDFQERVIFFQEVRRILKPGGRVVVTEHLRNLPNLIAYNLGAWHFHPRSEWIATFTEAGLQVVDEQARNLLITTFILQDHEASS